MTDKKKEVSTDSEVEEEIDIEEKETVEEERTKSDKDDRKDSETELETDAGKSTGLESNGFPSFHHRLTDKFLKRKYPDSDDSDEDADEEDNVSRNMSRKRVSPEEHFAHRIRKEQLFPMDASLKTLSDSGLCMNSIISRSSVCSSTVSSRCEDRLKPGGSGDPASAGSSSVEKSLRPVASKADEQKQLHKPSFLITDILSSDRSSRKERETCHSVFSDPRLFAMSHRNFLDRPLPPTGPCAGLERGVPRFDDDDEDDSDYDNDDKSEGDGNCLIARITYYYPA